MEIVNQIVVYLQAANLEEDVMEADSIFISELHIVRIGEELILPLSV